MLSAALQPHHPRSLIESKSIPHSQKAASPVSKIKFKTIPSFLIRGANALHPQIPKQRGRYCVSLPSSSNLCVKCSVNEGAAGESLSDGDQQLPSQQRTGFWSKWKANSAEMISKLAKLGLAAVLAYGLFDGVTYTTFFILAFLGYEKSTGKNPAANLQALLGIVILMWTGNNVTRPFRVAGAAALAPVIDKGLKKIQKYFNFPDPVYAFALVVSIVASTCLTIAGLLILSRWGK
ncbi:uncharacterized protein LOC115675983 [Syzygium oleosum]|uniref:uncharacterized protein LOC115675983 n=1 Tax=Syzygium oleosum TaxID=219896 RepID=UPI0011D2673E|nr:uncharacterized protein LOC115675983 [Syzygium oleosum]